MINFNKLRWKNLLSYGETFQEVELCKAPITIITGPNGAGKSTILSALTFVLFGKPFTRITKQQLVNSVNEKGLMTEIEFNIGVTEYKVRRGIKPNVFEIYKNGKLQMQDARSIDQQKHLEDEILKISYKSFTQIVVLGSSTFVPFMQLSQNDRRSIIEDLLDIQIFGVMLSISKGKLSVLRDSISNVKYDIDINMNKIDMYTDTLNKALARNNIAKSKITDEVTQHTTNIAKLEDTLQQNDKQKTNLSSQVVEVDTSRLRLIEQAETTMNMKIKSINDSNKFLDDNDVCCTCNQIIDTTFKETKITDSNIEVAKLKTNLTKVMTDKIATTDKITANNTLNSQLHELSMEKYKLENDIKYNATCIAKLNANTTDIDTNIDTAEIESNINEVNKVLIDLNDVKKALLIEQYNNTIVANILKDDGIKTKIVKQYLPIMNSVINKYLKILDFHVDFRLDENFSETIRSRYRDSFSYASFSEGEKRKIDLSLLFAWREISRMRNNANTNILILDEVLDGSLDSTSVENFMSIIKEISGDIKVYIISHKADIVDNDYGVSLEVSKLGNYSRMQYI